MDIGAIIAIVISGAFTVWVAKIQSKSKKIDNETKDVREWFKRKKERSVSIIILDNDTEDSELVSKRLKKHGYNCEIFDDEDEMVENIAAHENVYIIDYYLTTKTGEEIARKVKARNHNNYVIVLSGFKSENMLRTLTNAGIDKFVFKNDPDYLEQIVIYVNDAVGIINNL